MADNIDSAPARDIRMRPSDPFRWLRSEVDRLFEDFEPSPRRLFSSWGPAFSGSFPPVDMREEGDKLILTADVAGYDKDQIDISIEDGSLILKGQRSEESRREDSGFLINERRHGEFERRLAMPSRIDLSGVKATLEKGTLTVEVPKVRDPQARRIEIQQAQ